MLCVGVLLALWWYVSRPLTDQANCLPLDYPQSPFYNGENPSRNIIAFRPSVFRTDIPLATIKEFYDTNLPHGTNWQDDQEGYWRRNEVRPGEFLYECGGTLGWDEVETGCIYLRVREGKTIVETNWLDMASGGQLCEWYMSELPE